MGSTLLILSLSGTMPVEKEILHILERGDAKRSIDALITLTLIPSTPSLLLLFREDTILIISSGVVGEAKKLSLKEPLKYDLWSTVEWGILVAREGPMLVKNSLNLLAIN